MYFRSSNNTKMKHFHSCTMLWTPFITLLETLKKKVEKWKRMLEATAEVFCKIDPPLAFNKSWKVS